MHLLQPHMHLLQPNMHLLKSHVYLLQPHINDLQSHIHLLQPHIHLLQSNMHLLQPHIHVLLYFILFDLCTFLTYKYIFRPTTILLYIYIYIHLLSCHSLKSEPFHSYVFCPEHTDAIYIFSSAYGSPVFCPKQILCV